MMYNDLKLLFKHATIILVILLFVRCCFAVAFVPLGIFADHPGILPLFFFNILRFDVQIICYILLLPTTLTLIVTAVRKPWTARFLSKFRRIYFSVIDVLVLMIGGIDLGFYANFNSHINLTFFDFFNEGPISLLQTIWEEYHCVYEGLAFLLIVTPLLWTIHRIEKPLYCAVTTKRKTITVWILFIVGLTIGLRGSIWRFPLQIEDTFVSDNKLINDLVTNGIYMLKKAFKEKKNAFKLKDTTQLLQEYRFTSLQEVLDIYTDGKVKLLNNDTLTALKQALFASVPDTLHGPQPNIVIIYSESWSDYLLDLQDKNTEMCFTLQRHLTEDLLFRNFQSVQNGTVAALENLFVATPYPRFFASAYRFRLMPTSMALPFRASGYTTTFMSGMDTAWENCAEALLHQHFQHIYDKFNLLKDYPSATYNSIGIYDEYLFTALLDQLNKSTKQPMMLALMTTTNHPPFEFLSNLRLPALPTSVYKKKCFAEHNQEVLQKYLTGFRYFNKTLGEFLDKFKASKAAQNTILIVTGDHNVRSILDYNIVEKRYKHAVPLYIYLPPALRNPVYKRLTNHWGSHDDILPTLAPFAFRNTTYFKMGKNLLDTMAPDSIYFSANVEQMEAQPNGLRRAIRKTKARNLLREVYFNSILPETTSTKHGSLHIEP